MSRDTILAINISSIVKAKDSLGNPTREVYQGLKNEVEPAFLCELLNLTQGNQTQAAKIAGIHRGTLATKLKQHDISASEFVSNDDLAVEVQS